jgi:hypothetical protein
VETISADAVYRPSDDVVAREIEGELIIVPLAAGVGDMEDELFTLNETGRAIWGRLDGVQSVRQVVAALAAEYSSPAAEMERDVQGFLGELLKRKIIVRADG